MTAAGIARADWPQFRGPDGSASVPDAVLPTHLEAGRHLTWDVPLPGRGLSSPIVVGDRVIVTAASGPRQTRLHVLCFRTTDGVTLWERQIFATGRTMCHEKTCVAANTPASDGHRIFALFSCNDLAAFDLEGNLLWLRALSLDYPNVSNSLGMSSSLVVVEGTVVTQVENDTQSLALGLDALTGVNRWRLDRPRLANWTSPIVFTDPVHRRPHVGLQSGKGLQVIDPVTGAEVWNFGGGASTIPSSAAGGGLILVPSNGITALRPGSPGEPVTQVWRSGPLRPGTSTPVVQGNRVFTINGTGVLGCGALEDGRRLWQLRLQGPFSASPVMAGPYLYVPNEEGLLQVVDTTPAEEGVVVGQLPLGESILSTPAISGNALYLRSDRHLWKISGS